MSNRDAVQRAFAAFARSPKRQPDLERFLDVADACTEGDVTFKVLECGNAPVFVGRCGCCNTVFECEVSDGRYVEEQAFFHAHPVVKSRHLEVECPTCGVQVEAKPQS